MEVVASAAQRYPRECCHRVNAESNNVEALWKRQTAAERSSYVRVDRSPSA
jgi:hypothetical protein